MKKTIIIQSQISRKNHDKTFKKLIQKFGIENPENYVLHHKDMSLRTEDQERYCKWLMKDVVLMTKKDHLKLHMKIRNPKGSVKTAEHKHRISEGVKAAKKAFSGKQIRIQRPAQNAVDMSFTSCGAAAKFIGCSKQAICQAVKHIGYTVYGYTISVEDNMF